MNRPVSLPGLASRWVEPGYTFISWVGFVFVLVAPALLNLPPSPPWVVVPLSAAHGLVGADLNRGLAPGSPPDPDARLA